MCVNETNNSSGSSSWIHKKKCKRNGKGVLCYYHTNPPYERLSRMSKNWNIFSADLKYTLLYVFSRYNMMGWNIICFIMSSERHLFFCAYWISFFPSSNICVVFYMLQGFWCFDFYYDTCFWVVCCPSWKCESGASQPQSTRI